MGMGKWTWACKWAHLGRIGRREESKALPMPQGQLFNWKECSSRPFSRRRKWTISSLVSTLTMILTSNCLYRPRRVPTRSPRFIQRSTRLFPLLSLSARILLLLHSHRMSPSEPATLTIPLPPLSPTRSKRISSLQTPSLQLGALPLLPVALARQSLPRLSTHLSPRPSPPAYLAQ